LIRKNFNCSILFLFKYKNSFFLTQQTEQIWGFRASGFPKLHLLGTTFREEGASPAEKHPEKYFSSSMCLSRGKSKLHLVDLKLKANQFFLSLAFFTG
jgi:hypothetical protein